MGGLNRATLIGRLGKDPQTRSTQSGQAVCNFSIATSERRKQGEEWVEHTEWHKVTAWAKRAEACQMYLKKGSEVYIEGPIRTRKWKDKDGKEQWTTEIVVDVMHFMGVAKAKSGGMAEPSPQDTGFDHGEDVPF